MNNYIPKFKSVFKEEFKDFILYKRSLGYKYSKISCDRYKRLDYYFASIYLNEKKITQETIDGWYREFRNCKESNKITNGYSVYKNFSEYLILNNYSDITLSNEVIKRYNGFIPYIFTKEQIEKIFKHIKYLIATYPRYKNYYSCYVIISILFGCGLRVSEAVHLKHKDIDLENKILFIENSKSNASRVVPISNSVYLILTEYISSKSTYSLNEYVFTQLNGKQISEYTPRVFFRKVLKEIDIPLTYENKIPRLHDIRHTFAVHSLEQMEEKGFDIYTSLSILSVYLGHQTIKETEKYLRLTKEMHQKVEEMVHQYTNNIYKEKEIYEKQI